MSPAERLVSPSGGAPRGRLRRDEPLARYTTWGVGGPARRLYEPADLDDLGEFLAALPATEPVFWLGLGSNLLVRDGGIRGTVIRMSGLGAIRAEQGAALRAECGVPCPKVARFAAARGWSGAEFLAGIPGTLGGALAMNAGAFGGDTWSLVRRVEVVDRAGRRHTRGLEDYRVGYRQIQGPPGEWFLAAWLGLAPGANGVAQARIRELLRRRGETQPLGQRSCGSVFRNPPGDHAARLIESAGLKGRCRGGACVSERHANFIINRGAATAAEIEALIEEVAETVSRLHGVELAREVKIVGERGAPGGEG